MCLKESKEIVVSIKTNSNIAGTFSEELAYNLGEQAVILMNFITFDKNMRLITQISVIDGWHFEIKYINYEVSRPVKRQKI